MSASERVSIIVTMETQETLRTEQIKVNEGNFCRLYYKVLVIKTCLSLHTSFAC